MSKHLLHKHICIYTFFSESLIQHPHNGCLLDFKLFFRRKYDLIVIYFAVGSSCVSCVLTWTFLFHHSWKPKEFNLFHLVVSGLQLKRFYTHHVSIHICPDVQQFTNGGRKR